MREPRNELTDQIVTDDSPHGQNGTRCRRHTGCDNANQTPPSQEGRRLIDQELDKGLMVRDPKSAGGGSQMGTARVSLKGAVDRVRPVVDTVWLVQTMTVPKMVSQTVVRVPKQFSPFTRSVFDTYRVIDPK